MHGETVKFKNLHFFLCRISNHFYNIYKRDCCVVLRAVRPWHGLFYFVWLSIMLQLDRRVLETSKTFFPTAVHFIGSLFCIDWIRTALSISNIIRQFFQYIPNFASSGWCNCVVSCKISVGPEMTPQKWLRIDFCSICDSCTSKASVFSSVLLCVCKKLTLKMQQVTFITQFHVAVKVKYKVYI